MKVYGFVIIGLIALSVYDRMLVGSRSNKPTKGTMFFMVALLSVVAGLRYNVGTDYYNYYSSYEYFKTAPLALNDEPGIRIIARIASQIWDDPAMMMLLAAVITVILMATTVLKNSQMYWISILLYVFLCCWHGCFNGVRQYLAAAVLFAGHHFVKEQKLLEWCIIVFLACMCHITAIVGLIFYFYPKVKTSFISVALSIAGAMVGISMYDRIFGFIEFLKSDSFDFEGVGSGYLTNSINPLRIAVAWSPVIFFLLFKKYYDVRSKEFRFYINMTILHAALMTTALNSTYLGRVGIYTGIFNTITWPLLLEKVEEKSKAVLIVFMLSAYAVYWSVEATGPTLVNFQWIFQR